MPEPPYGIRYGGEEAVTNEEGTNILGWDIPIPGWNGDVIGWARWATGNEKGTSILGGDVLGWGIPIPGRNGDITGGARWATAEGAPPSSRGVTPRTRDTPNDRMAHPFSFVTLSTVTASRSAHEREERGAPQR